MPAPLSLSKATITRPDDVLEDVSILIRLGVATVRRGRDIVAKEDVVLVEALSGRTWQLTLADGSIWSVVRARGCGCGH